MSKTELLKTLRESSCRIYIVTRHVTRRKNYFHLDAFVLRNGLDLIKISETVAGFLRLRCHQDGAILSPWHGKATVGKLSYELFGNEEAIACIEL